MSKLKPLGPGETLTLRIPNDVDPRIIEYINGDLPEKRNKHLLNLLFSKINEEIRGNKANLSIQLPGNFSETQKHELKKSITSLLSVMTGDIPYEKSESPEDIIITEDTQQLFAGLVEIDD
jgi:hypothetical protein